jgi:taurine--2-oxoglutarate transaminase
VLLRERLEELERRHPCVGATRSIGLFGIVELARSRNPYEPMTPYNGTSDEMRALSRLFRQEGLYTFVRWSNFFANPPLVIDEAQLDEAFGIIHRCLSRIG